MAECWAETLGSCSTKQSREHYVSKSVIGSEYVDVRGLPWCSDEFRRIPAAGFVRSMLCKHHNESLSPLDEAGGEAFHSFCRFVDVIVFRETQRARQRRPRQKRLQQYHIEGKMLERWLLKTTINIAYRRPLFSQAQWTPPSEWVEIVFGRRPFPPKAGLYLALHGWRKVHTGDRFIGIQLLDRRGEELVGAGFEFGFLGVAIATTPLLENGLHYRPQFFKDKRLLSSQQVIKFHW
jgi:hypothetical protein